MPSGNRIAQWLGAGHLGQTLPSPQASYVTWASYLTCLCLSFLPGKMALGVGEGGIQHSKS